MIKVAFFLGIFFLLHCEASSPEAQADIGDSGSHDEVHDGAVSDGSLPDGPDIVDSAVHDADASMPVEDLGGMDAVTSQFDTSWSYSCAGKAYPANTGFEGAIELSVGQYEDLLLCEHNVDYFALYLFAGDEVSIVLTDSDAADLVFDLHSVDYPLALAVTSANKNVYDTGYHYLKVYSFSYQSGAYKLQIENNNQSYCASEDDSETKAVYWDATVLTLPLPSDYEQLQLCNYHSDWYKFSAAAGDSFQVSISDTDEYLYLSLYQMIDQRLVHIMTQDADEGGIESVGQDFIGLDPAYYIQVGARDRENHDYWLSFEKEPQSGHTSGVVQGTIRYEDFPVTEAGYGPSSFVPLPFAEVEIVRINDDQVIAYGYTNGDGFYSISYQNYGPSGIYARVLTRNTKGIFNHSVKDTAESNTLYAVRSAEDFDDSKGTSFLADMDITIDINSGAFNIFDKALLGTILARSIAPYPTPHLTLFWKKGQDYWCRSCYLNNQINIGGSASDPDEFDDSVILHEFGHYVLDNYGKDDNDGGDHDGSRTNPVLAWSEGFATMYSALVRQNSRYYDYNITETSVVDIAATDVPEFYGTGPDGDGGMTEVVSEYLVAAVMWNLNKVATYPPGQVIFPALRYPTSLNYVDDGYPGVDLADYLNGWFCLYGALDINPVKSVVEERQFPYHFDEIPTCSPKPQAKVSLFLDGIEPGNGELKVLFRVIPKKSAKWARTMIRFQDDLEYEVIEGGEEKMVYQIQAGQQISHELTILPRNMKSFRIYAGVTTGLSEAVKLHRSIGRVYRAGRLVRIPESAHLGRRTRDRLNQRIVEDRAK